MTDQNAQEPTMEEILASIRRIISEDDAPAETAAPATLSEPETEYEPEPQSSPDPTPEPEPVVAAEPAPVQAQDDVLDLTERFEAPPAETIGDLDVVEAQVEPEPFPAPAPAAEPEAWSPQEPSSDGALVGESAAASAASAFAGLAASFKKPEAPAPGQEWNFASGSTVEAMVADMLRPMLKEWLDANLPGIVEAQVRREVERIARDAG